MKARHLFAASFLTGLAISPASGLDRHVPQVRVETRFIETTSAHSLGFTFGEGSRVNSVHQPQTTGISANGSDIDLHPRSDCPPSRSIAVPRLVTRPDGPALVKFFPSIPVVDQAPALPGQLPVLRTLFGGKPSAVTDTRERENLVIIVTPRLILPAD